MYSQREKIRKISLLSLGVMIIISFFAIINMSYLFILISLYFISISLFADAILLLHAQRQTDAIKQLIRTLILFILTTLLVIFYFKNL